MKRSRDTEYSRENSIKQAANGKIIYHCRFCTFIACTEGNIEKHVQVKHKNDSEMKENKQN